MSNALQDKVYIVTGASGGFGLGIAKTLITHGAKVALLSRGQHALDKAVADIGSDSALGVACDVTSGEQIKQAFAYVVEHFGQLDGLVNNAGMARPNKVEHLSEAEVVIQINTNFLGTVLCCQAAIPLLRHSQNAKIINISSASAWHYDEMSHLSIYAATKAAVERFTRDLRLELQCDGIGVTCIRPGGAWTNFADGWEAEPLEEALRGWKDMGAYMDTGMDVQHVADSVFYAASLPVGVAVDLLEVRPNILTPK